MPILRGWKEIIDYAKIGEEKLKIFIEEEKFPIQFFGRDPYSSTEVIDEWFKKRLNGKTCQDPG